MLNSSWKKSELWWAIFSRFGARVFWFSLCFFLTLSCNLQMHKPQWLYLPHKKTSERNFNSPEKDIPILDSKFTRATRQLWKLSHHLNWILNSAPQSIISHTKFNLTWFFYLFSDRRKSHLNTQKTYPVVEKHKYPLLLLVFLRKHNFRHRFLSLQTQEMNSHFPLPLSALMLA